MMKIVHCIWSFNIGGAENMLIDIVNEQVKTCSEYVVIVNNSYNTELLSKIDSKVRVVKIGRNPNSRSILPFFKLNYQLVKIQPDIIHMHNVYLSRIVAPWISHGQFLTVHDLQIPIESVRHGVRLIAISEAVAEDVQKRANRKIVIISNGISLDAIQKKSECFGKDPFKIVQVGRLDSDKKGQDILIKAVSQLCKKDVKVHVDFIGEGNSLASLKQLVKSCNMESNVSFLGSMDRKYIYEHLKDYDMMCHPSRYEGFGLTVAEGMAAKLPVLVSNEGGPFEIIKHGELGFSFNQGDSFDCARVIEKLINNRELLNSKVDNAYVYVKSNFSIRRMVLSYINEYKKVLGQ